MADFSTANFLKEWEEFMKVYGMQHVGFTVPDLDEAVAFFTKLFGAVECLSTGSSAGSADASRRRRGLASKKRALCAKCPI